MNDFRPRCRKCHRVLTDPVSIAAGVGPVCRGDVGRGGSSSVRSRRGRGRAYVDPAYINTTLFTVYTESDKDEKKRNRLLLESNLPIPAGDVTFYYLPDRGAWQSSGGSRVFTAEELERILQEAGLI